MRCRILLTNGHILSWKDLAVGDSVNIYNTIYHLHSCDAFTRDFMARHGHPQPPDHDPPLDEYHAHLLERKHLQDEAAARVAAEHAAEKPNRGSLHSLDNARIVRVHGPCVILPARVRRRGDAAGLAGAALLRLLGRLAAAVRGQDAVRPALLPLG